MEEKFHFPMFGKKDPKWSKTSQKWTYLKTFRNTFISFLQFLQYKFKYHKTCIKCGKTHIWGFGLKIGLGPKIGPMPRMGFFENISILAKG